jgi:small subunit ribosomal protein S4
MLVEAISDRSVPAWLDVSKDTASATVVALPTRSDVEFPFEEHLIVELYSK